LTFGFGTKGTLYSDDFRCGSDGSVFLTAYEEGVNRSGNFELLSLRPTGDVVHLVAPTPPGYRALSPPEKFFVTDAHVFQLGTAAKLDPTDPSKSSGYSSFIVEYDYKGSWVSTIKLETRLNPLALATFESGDFLIVSEDKFSERVRMLVVGQDGERRSELNLFDRDYIDHIKSSANILPEDAPQYLRRMMSFAQYLPYGKNLLVVPKQTSLPVIKLNEHGVVASVRLQLPKGKTLARLLPTNGRDLIARSGSGTSDAYSADGSGKSAVYTTEPMLFEFDPTEGKLIPTAKVAPDLTPLCQRDGEYSFLTTRPEDGRLQIVRAPPGR